MEQPRRLQSGRWQARYATPNGERRSAGVYATKREASKAMASSLARPEVRPVEGGTMPFRVYAEQTFRYREHDLAESTLANYRHLATKYLYPMFGDRPLRSIRRADVRLWWSTLPESVNRRHAFMVLSGILNCAVRDEELEMNAARLAIKNAGRDLSKRRPLLELEDFWRIHDLCSTDVQTLLQVTLGGSLRIGEALGLDRRHVDWSSGILTIEQQFSGGAAGGQVLKQKLKSGGPREVHLPGDVLSTLRAYVRRRPSIGALFTGDHGQRLHRGSVYRQWNAARSQVGLEWVHIHDLRHLSLTLVAQQGATIRELMDRGGHSTPATALRYQHSAAERQALLAKKLNDGLRRTSG